MKAKTLGGIQLVGALAAIVLSWPLRDWADIVLAVIFLVTAIHHFTEKKH